MAGLDLSGVRRVIDGWLVDTVRCVRDNGNADDVLDPVTGELVSPAAPVVYDGPGGMIPIVQADLADPDVATYYQRLGARYKLLLPMGASDGVTFRQNDLWSVTAVVSTSGDPTLVGQQFAAVDPPAPSSFAAVRIIYVRPV
jgi:Family of unknown function (DUF6093)